MIEPRTVGTQAIPFEDGWQYSVAIESADVPGLLTAIVTVQNTESRPPISVSITRLVIDPDYDPLEARRNEE